MIRYHQYMLLCLISVTTLLACIGCEPDQASQIEAVSSRPTPEQSFSEIAQMVKDGIELRGSGKVSGFVKQSTGTSTRFQVHNTVESEVIPPTNANGSYFGKITVTSKSIYSVRRSADAEEEKDVDESKAGGFSPMDNLDGSATGFEVLDNELISGSAVGKKANTALDEKESVQRHADEEVRTYDFSYENNRWVLKSTLDPDTEKSIASAFERALRLQP